MQKANKKEKVIGATIYIDKKILDLLASTDVKFQGLSPKTNSDKIHFLILNYQLYIKNI